MSETSPQKVREAAAYLNCSIRELYERAHLFYFEEEDYRRVSDCLHDLHESGFVHQFVCIYISFNVPETGE